MRDGVFQDNGHTRYLFFINRENDIAIRYQDNGIGISDNKIERILSHTNGIIPPPDYTQPHEILGIYGRFTRETGNRKECFV